MRQKLSSPQSWKRKRATLKVCGGRRGLNSNIWNSQGHPVFFYHAAQPSKGHGVHHLFIHLQQHPISMATALKCEWGRRGACGGGELLLGTWRADPDFPKTAQSPSHQKTSFTQTTTPENNWDVQGAISTLWLWSKREGLTEGFFSIQMCRHASPSFRKCFCFYFSSFASMGGTAASALHPHKLPQRSGDARPLRWVTLEVVNARLTEQKQICHLTPAPVHSLYPQHLCFGAEQQHAGRCLHTFTPIFPDSSFPPSFCLLFHLCAFIFITPTQKNT